jgi:hypothetical protein
MYLTVIFPNVFRGSICWVNGRRMHVWNKTRVDKYGERIVYHENVVDSCRFWEVKCRTKTWQGRRKCIHKNSMSHAITVLFCVTSVVRRRGGGPTGVAQGTAAGGGVGGEGGKEAGEEPVEGGGKRIDSRGTA